MTGGVEFLLSVGHATEVSCSSTRKKRGGSSSDLRLLPAPSCFVLSLGQADLQAAGGQVNSLENEVADLRNRLEILGATEDSFEQHGDSSSPVPYNGEEGSMVASRVKESPLSRHKVLLTLCCCCAGDGSCACAGNCEFRWIFFL